MRSRRGARGLLLGLLVAVAVAVPGLSGCAAGSAHRDGAAGRAGGCFEGHDRFVVGVQADLARIGVALVEAGHPPHELHRGWEAGPMAVSPDGEHVAFVRWIGGQPSDRRRQRKELWVSDVDGAHARRLQRDIDLLSLTWTADGRTLLFIREDGDGRSDLGSIPADGGSTQVITPIEEGGDAWMTVAASPKGDLLAMQGIDSRVMVVDTQGHLKRTLHIDGYVNAVTWNPDGRSLLVGTTWGDERPDLFLAPIDGGRIRVVGHASAAAWSVDHQRLYVLDDRGRGGQEERLALARGFLEGTHLRTRPIRPVPSGEAEPGSPIGYSAVAAVAC